MQHHIVEAPDDPPPGGQADTPAEAITPETINGLIERMPELALWPRDQVERLAPDLLTNEAEAKAERQHRDPTGPV